ncbi:hypothetical protein HUN61_00875 [Neoehrlichia mikurensis]|uniref:cell envelope integrity protein TolA n=1 Tax=Neoehrlichia mikurensis TaxID=89586 RepID=UPI001C48A2FA|nr:cell envelope integrity protein TolA [Neoehrlichia mikurensis]QXK92579.1 hypothetical protein HUN61_00875 [Neoehrlichia mikurensis]
MLIISLFLIKLPNLHFKKNNPSTNQIVVIDTLPLNTVNNIPLQQSPKTSHNSTSINKFTTKNNVNYKKHTVETKSPNLNKRTDKNVTTVNSSNKINTISKKKFPNLNKKTDKNITTVNSNNKTNTISKKRSPNENTIKQHMSPKQELASILKSLEKGSTANKNQDGYIGQGDVKYDKDNPISITILDAIRSKFIKCWTIPAGAKNIGNLQIIINVTLSLEGKVITAEVSDQYSYNNDHFFRAIADSALRAVYKCSPLIGLSKKHYHIWHNISLNFDPQHMF